MNEGLNRVEVEKNHGVMQRAVRRREGVGSQEETQAAGPVEA